MHIALLMTACFGGGDYMLAATPVDYAFVPLTVEHIAIVSPSQKPATKPKPRAKVVCVGGVCRLTTLNADPTTSRAQPVVIRTTVQQTVYTQRPVRRILRRRPLRGFFCRR